MLRAGAGRLRARHAQGEHGAPLAVAARRGPAAAPARRARDAALLLRCALLEDRDRGAHHAAARCQVDRHVEIVGRSSLPPRPRGRWWPHVVLASALDIVAEFFLRLSTRPGARPHTSNRASSPSTHSAYATRSSAGLYAPSLHPLSTHPLQVRIRPTPRDLKQAPRRRGLPLDRHGLLAVGGGRRARHRR